jgi:putative membrane protein
MTPADLPTVNAILNGLSALFLTAGYIAIRQGRTGAHRKLMLAAFSISTLFLISYLTYHSYVAYVLQRGPTRFVDPAWFRPYYLAILLTHTILAAAVLPMVLITLFHGWRGVFDRHRRIARWTWPLWMYVSITGVTIYLLLYRIFPQQQ